MRLVFKLAEVCNFEGLAEIKWVRKRKGGIKGKKS
jgi:hypothetical protein